jgi:phenylacetate-CoA ligase
LRFSWNLIPAKELDKWSHMSDPDAIDPNIIFNAKPAVQPGAHAPAGFVSPEYDEKIVADQIAYLEKGERMSLDEMAAHQLERLRDLLIHAGRYVPYWRSLFQKIAFVPSEISSVSDLEQLPLLDKDMIKADYKAFISENINPELVSYMTTGGSTGTPLKILMDREYRSRNHAATRYYLSKAGVMPGAERGVRLHGNAIPADALARGEYWIIEGNRLTMSVSHISADTCFAYMDKIRSFKPNYIHAYASALVLLARLAEQLKESFPDSIQNVFCDSETTYSWQRDLIRRTTGAQFFNIYGHTEGAAMAITFPNSNSLEALPHMGVMEILDPSGRSLSQPGERGEIVATGFNNKVMPFIRYRTFDMAVIGKMMEGNLRPFRPILESVEGRLQDYLVGNDHSLVPAAPLLFDYNFDWTGIDLFQVFQKLPGMLEFKIVPSASVRFDENLLRQRIIEGFSEIFSNKFCITVSFHSKLSCTSRGKFRYVDQKIEINA